MGISGGNHAPLINLKESIMKVTKQVNGKTFVYFSETVEALRSVAQSTVAALTCIHRTKETVEQARIAWFIAASESLRNPINEDATLAMLATKQVDRTKAQTTHYNAINKAWQRFRDTHGLEKGKARGKPGLKGKATDKKVDATPKAVNAKGADSFLRQQAAMLQAYGEKNKPMLSTAMLHAIGEFVEAINTIPNQD
jgi:hypothetical protein